MKTTLILIALALFLSAPKITVIVNRLCAADPIVHERIVTEKKILSAMNNLLSAKIRAVEAKSGFDTTRWCDGLRHTPVNIKSEIGRARIDDAYRDLVYAFTRTEIIWRCLENPLFLKASSQRRLNVLLDLATKPGIVTKGEIDAQIEPYTFALERVRSTKRVEDFETELKLLSKQKDETSVASLAE